MIIEVVIEVVIEVILPFLARLLGWFFVELLGHVVCYLTGYGLLKVITLGRHPKTYASPWSEANKDFYVMLTGGVFWLSMWLIWAVS